MSSDRRLLVVNSSSRLTRSVTRRLTRYAADGWQARYVRASVEYCDVGLNGIPMVDENWIAAAYTPAADRSVPMQSALALSEGLVDQIARAEAIVIGVPHYNFGLPATLKAYFEQIVRVGRTFGFRSEDAVNPYVGLLPDRPVLIATSSGAAGTEPDGANHHLNFIDPQLLAILRLIGLDAVTFARVTHQQGKPEQVADSISRAEQVIDSWVESLPS